MKGWLTVRITEGDIVNGCPMAGSEPEGCPAEADEEDVIATCDEEVVKAYRKFKVIKGPKGHLMRECPKCETLSECSGWRTEVLCTNPECGYRFCKVHVCSAWCVVPGM